MKLISFVFLVCVFVNAQFEGNTKITCYIADSRTPVVIRDGEPNGWLAKNADKTKEEFKKSVTEQGLLATEIAHVQSDSGNYVSCYPEPVETDTVQYNYKIVVPNLMEYPADLQHLRFKNNHPQELDGDSVKLYLNRFYLGKANTAVVEYKKDNKTVEYTFVKPYGIPSRYVEKYRYHKGTWVEDPGLMGAIAGVDASNFVQKNAKDKKKHSKKGALMRLRQSLHSKNKLTSKTQTRAHKIYKKQTRSHTTHTRSH